MVRGRCCMRHCVASTCSTSLVPMPNASAPNAPWVDVCESPQTMVMPGWVAPEFRPDDVHDALVGRVEVEQRQAERACVAGEGAHLLRGDRVGDRQVPVAGGDVVVDGGERALGPPHPAPGEPQALERLGRRDLVHQVQVDVQQRRSARHRVHDVGIPDLLEEGARLAHQTAAGSCAFAAAALPSSLHGIMTRSARPVFSSR